MYRKILFYGMLLCGVTNVYVSAMNIEAARYNAQSAAQRIAVQTKQQMSAQTVSYRGISLDGSPQLVIQEILNNGNKLAVFTYLDIMRNNGYYGQGIEEEARRYVAAAMHNAGIRI